MVSVNTIRTKANFYENITFGYVEAPRKSNTTCINSIDRSPLRSYSLEYTLKQRPQLFSTYNLNTLIIENTIEPCALVKPKGTTKSLEWAKFKKVH